MLCVVVGLDVDVIVDDDELSVEEVVEEVVPVDVDVLWVVLVIVVDVVVEEVVESGLMYCKLIIDVVPSLFSCSPPVVE